VIDSSILFGILLCLLGGGLIGWHFVRWRTLDRAEHDEQQRTYYRRQLIRRGKASSLILCIGAMFIADPWVTGRLRAAFFLACPAMLLWLLLLALADARAIYYHFGPARDAHLRELARLRAELYQAEQVRQAHRLGQNGATPHVDGDGVGG
jgi:hypothetical protein